MNLSLNIPNQFYEAETLCGYAVSSEDKELWAVELDLLNTTIRIFEEHGIRYFAMGGTLLGAARHQGFIPWDNDIDIIVPREDYDILLANGSAWFQDPYFFQTPSTEKGFFRSHVQIRNKETLGYIPKDAYRPCCKGVFIDVFVLDTVPDNWLARNIHVRIADFIRSVGVLAMDHGSENLKPYGFVIKGASTVAHLFMSLVGFDRWFSFYNRFLAIFRNLKSGSVAHLTISYHEGKCWKRADFEKSCKLPFHMLQLNCPSNYYEVLQKQYGTNVMEIPTSPPSSTHGAILFKGERNQSEQ